MQHRIPRVVGALGMAMTLASGMFTGTALAATPLVYLYVTPTPPQATQGAPVGFIVTVDNQDTSNTSQATIDATIPAGTTYVGVYPSSTSCSTATGDVVCDLGNIKGGTQKSIALVFQTTPTMTGQVTTTVQGYTTGTPSDQGGNSHGDSFINSPVTQSVTLVDSTNPDFSGRFLSDLLDSLIVQNSQTVGSTNLQATKVKAPGLGIAASVKDGPGNGSQDCITGTQMPANVCSSLFGETSTVDVGEGATFGTPFLITITFSKYELPAGVTAKTLAIYHTWVDASGLHEETISDPCTFSPKNSPTPNNAPCLVVQKSGADLIAGIWSFHNGNYRGW